MLLAITAVLWQGKPTPANMPRSHPAYAVLELGAQRNLFTLPAGYSKSTLLSRREVAEILFRAPNPGVLAPSFGSLKITAQFGWLLDHGWTSGEANQIKSVWRMVEPEIRLIIQNHEKNRPTCRGLGAGKVTNFPSTDRVPYTAKITNAFSNLPKQHWAYRAMKTLNEHGLFTGYSQTYFSGKRELTRYEMAVGLKRLIDQRRPHHINSNASEQPCRIENIVDCGHLKDLEYLTILLVYEFLPELNSMGTNVVNSDLSRLSGRTVMSLNQLKAFWKTNKIDPRRRR